MNEKERFARLIELVGEAMERVPESRDGFLVSTCDDERLLQEARALVAEADAESLDEITARLQAVVQAAAVEAAASGVALPARIGPYEVVRELGRGGMGVVYLGRQEEPIRRHVAIKLVRRSLVDPEALARFQAERQALARMQHPNIASVFDAGTTEDGLPYLVMEPVEGLPITEHGDRNVLDLDARLALFGAVCRAVQHAHERGVIHRDLKPSNILVQVIDGRATPKVIDFGVAKAVQGTLTDESIHTVAGHPVGTLDYMSPEQVRGSPAEIDARTDVYALGVVLYELIAGRHPFAETGFRTSGLIEARRMILELEPPRPSVLASTGSRGGERPSPPAGARRRFRRELDWIVLKAIEKDPRRRYSSALELAEDLERFARNEPVRAGPPGLAYRARKLARRHRTAVAAAPLLALTLLTGTLLGRWGEGGTVAAAASVAVLPFVNLSTDPEQAYFSDGLTEEILNVLAQTPGLQVAARSSSFQLRDDPGDVRDVGRRLGVSTVLEGSVRLHADSLRVTAQLIDTESGYHLWSGHYDRLVGDVFFVQEEVARAVAGALSTQLLSDDIASPTTNVEAYRLYLRGRHAWRDRTEEGMWAALDAFNRAIALDSSYAEAWTGLADTWQLLPDYGGVAPSEGQARGKAAALRALALDSMLAEAHVSLGALLDDYDRDREGAEAAYRRAIELNPGYATARHWLANHLADGGRFEEALEQIEHARRLDPLSNIVNTAVGAIHYFARDYERAIAEYRSLLQVQPGFALAWALLGRVELVAGQVEDALASLERAIALSGGDPGYRAVYAAALAEAGRIEEARAEAETVRGGSPGGYVPYCELASAYIRLGDLEEALALIRIGVEQQDPAITHIGAEPLYDELREHSEFQELLRLVGLTAG